MPKAEERLVREARRGLLALLARRAVVENGTVYGYALRKTLAEALGSPPPESTLYDVLKRLEKLGLLKGRWARGPDGTVRKYYQPGPKAAEALAKALDEVCRLLNTLCTRGKR